MEKSLFQTPDTSFLTVQDKELVYDPAEDTFLLLDALQKDYQLIIDSKPSLALEVGCGSGIVSTFLSSMMEQRVHVICTDINEAATSITSQTASHNGTQVSPILMDLVSAFGSKLNGLIDILVFNPPYVITPSEEVGSKGIEASWAGGVKGREVLDRLLPSIGTLLSNKGMFYLVALKENDIEEIASILGEQGLQMTIVMERRSGMEYLMILRFQR